MAKRKLTPKNQDKAVPVVQCPPEISAAARKIWDELAPQLMAEGRLSELERIPLAILCSAVADWFAADEALQTYGAVIKAPSGFPVQSPYVSIAAKHLETIIRLCLEFGLTPASRGRVPRPSSSSSWMDDFPVLDTSDLKTIEP
jgi:P27 family predicted phage terminase small subunit